MEGRHFLANINVNKILDAGYWWPTLFKDILQIFGRVIISYMNFAKVVIVVRKLEDLKQKVWSSG
jgi:hypothetical protein